MDKRPRQFVGKRPRQFVGKRDFDSLEFLKDNNYPVEYYLYGSQNANDAILEEQLKDLMAGVDPSIAGDYFTQAEAMDVSKRPRQFVGKRNLAEEQSAFNILEEPYLQQLPSLTAQKRVREFVGKRSDGVDVDNSLDELKMLGELLGHASDKQFRELVKSIEFPESELTAGSGDGMIEADKRPRQFVGKRESSTAEDDQSEVSPVGYLSSGQFVDFIGDR